MENTGMIPGLAATTTYLPEEEWTGLEIAGRDRTFRSRRTFRMKIDVGEKKFQLPRDKSPHHQNDEEEKTIDAPNQQL